MRPNIESFDPTVIPWQNDFVFDFWNNILPRAEEHGVQIIILSGAVGSAKSLCMEHVLSAYAMTYKKARIGLGRRTLPDLKETLFNGILEHIPERAYAKKPNMNNGVLLLKNKTRFKCWSWADTKYKKVRSTEFEAFAIEEGTETDTSEAFDEILMRIRGGKGSKGSTKSSFPRFLIIATNPDSPSHWIYKKLIEKAANINGKRICSEKDCSLNEDGKYEKYDPNIWVYYSVTTDNPFLEESYKRNVLNQLTEQLAQRMIYGKWLDIAGEGIYHAYDEEVNFIKEDYEIKKNYPIHITFDFNTGLGKPMSACAFQYVDDKFHFFKEWILENSNTHELMKEIVNDGILDLNHKFIINGDAAGKAKQPSALDNDYAIIKQYLDHYKNKVINYQIKVPKANPAIKLRHNRSNGYMKNIHQQVRLFVYHTCPTVNEAFKGTKLKKGSTYQEDDSKYFQHVGTAATYGIYECTKKQSSFRKL
jgi:PBSX family phage terminase large subunit